MHIFPPLAAGYAYPDNKFLCWLYGAGSLAGLMAEYRFTNAGIDALNGWMSSLGDEELTDARRGALQRSHRSLMSSLILSGDVWKQANNEFRITAFWFQTTTPQT